MEISGMTVFLIAEVTFLLGLGIGVSLANYLWRRDIKKLHKARK